MLHLNSFVWVWKKYFWEKWQYVYTACGYFTRKLPALNNVKNFSRGTVAQQVTEPEKFNLPTVKYVLSVSESSNSIQNYLLEAVILAKEGCSGCGIGQNTVRKASNAASHSWDANHWPTWRSLISPCFRSMVICDWLTFK